MRDRRLREHVQRLRKINQEIGAHLELLEREAEFEIAIRACVSKARAIRRSPLVIAGDQLDRRLDAIVQMLWDCEEMLRRRR